MSHRLRLLVFLSNILGVRQVSAYFRREIDSLNDLAVPEYVYFDAADYHSLDDCPKWHPWKSVFITSYCARNKIAVRDWSQVDAVFVAGIELAYAVEPFTRNVPLIMWTDTTDRLSHRLIYDRLPTPLNYAKMKLKDAVTGFAYRRAFRNVDVAFCDTEWCGASLVNDYGLQQERVLLTMGGIDTDVWSPTSSESSVGNGKLRLLFVANAFVPKGGRFLLNLFKNSLAKKCTLAMVSNAPDLADESLPEGVTLYRGFDHDHLDDLIRLYQSCDVLVLPTYNDKLPQVLREAAAVGLPMIVRDCGAISSIVIDRWNGRLLPYESSHDEWRDAILDLADNREERLRLGKNSRAFAVEHVSRKSINSALRRAFEIVSQADTSSTCG